MYHQVGEFPAPTHHKAGFCHIRRFRAQLGYLHRFGYRVISLDQALAGLFGGEVLPHRAVVLTFDDGYQNFYDHAYPALLEYRMPATVFLVADLLGENARWLEADGRYGPPLLDVQKIKEMHQHNISFGSHTLNHVRLSRIEPDRMRTEIIDSKSRLEDRLGEPVDHFCYPYGDYHQAARDTVIEAGYRSALTCIRGAANQADNRFEIPRKAISYGDNLIGYFWKLHMKHRRKDRH